MPIKQLTDKQIQEWTLEQKDQWWLDNVYKGDMPQLTIKSALTGALLGMVLSITNLYIGIRTGWTLGVGITSVIMSFAIYKVFAQLRLGKEMTILENNAMQSIATSAGYTVSPLIASISGYMMVTGKVVPMWQVYCWLVVLGLMGTLFAFPLKKRAINDEQMPFPEGYAAGVVLDNLYSSQGKEGMQKAKMLVGAGLLAAVVEFLRSSIAYTYMKFIALPHYLDEWIYKFFTPSIGGVPLKDLTIRLDSSIVMMGTGMLMNMKTATSMLLGSIFNYFILAPIMINQGIITGGGFKNISIWALWGGAAMMTSSSLYSFAASDSTIASVKKFFSTIMGKEKKNKKPKKDVLAHIELPLKYSLIGVPVLTVITGFMANAFFGVNPLLAGVAVVLVFALSIMAVKSTGLTAITPLSAIAKITQVVFAVLAPGDKGVNLITAGITSNVSAGASNLLMDIKPGYMLGAKPRHQAIGHAIGVVFGCMAVIPAFYFLFGGDISVFGTEKFPMPSALVWKAVADVLADGLSALHPTAQLAVLIGAIAGVVVEIFNKKMNGKFPISAVGFGIAFVLRFVDVFSMFLGAFLFWYFKRQNKKKEYSSGFKSLIENNETVGAGIIAGGALVGITLMIIENL